MSKFIKLTTPQGKKVIVNVDSIAFFYEETDGTTLSFNIYGAKQTKVRESISQIEKLIFQ